MCKKIEASATSESRWAICFLDVKGIKPSQTHNQIYCVYREEAMSDSLVRKGYHFLTKDVMFMMMDRVIHNMIRWRLQKIDDSLMTLSLHFLEVSRSVLHETFCLIPQKIGFVYQRLGSSLDNQLGCLLENAYEIESCDWGKQRGILPGALCWFVTIPPPCRLPLQCNMFSQTMIEHSDHLLLQSKPCIEWIYLFNH